MLAARPRSHTLILRLLAEAPNRLCREPLEETSGRSNDFRAVVGYSRQPSRCPEVAVCTLYAMAMR